MDAARHDAILKSAQRLRANTYLASNDFYDTRLFRRCDNGRVIMVPWDYPYGGCPFFSTYGEGETSTPYTPNRQKSMHSMQFVQRE